MSTDSVSGALDSRHSDIPVDKFSRVHNSAFVATAGEGSGEAQGAETKRAMRLAEYVIRSAIMAALLLAAGAAALLGRGSTELRLGLGAFFFVAAVLAAANYVYSWRAGRVKPGFFKPRDSADKR